MRFISLLNLKNNLLNRFIKGSLFQIKALITFTCAALLLPQLLSATLQLQYIPAVPVQQISKVTVDIQESESLLNMNTQASQTFRFDLVGNNKLQSTQNLHLTSLLLPATLTMTIRDANIRVRSGGKEILFDSKRPTDSEALNEFSHLMNQPINLAVDSHGQLENRSDMFERLLKEHPALSQLPLDSIFKDLISGLFALYKEELSVGSKIEMESPHGPIFDIPAFVTYEITDINDNEVVATLKGKITPTSLFLDKTIQVANGRFEKVEMTFSGQMQGKVVWQRSNAMLHKGSYDYSYDAKLKAGDKKWTMKMRISQTVSSSKI